MEKMQISGTVRGTLGAGSRILWVILRNALSASRHGRRNP